MLSVQGGETECQSMAHPRTMGLKKKASNNDARGGIHRGVGPMCFNCLYSLIVEIFKGVGFGEPCARRSSPPAEGEKEPM